jgi:hypothetical protein
VAAYGVCISERLKAEIALQPHHVRDEFWSIYDQLERYGTTRSAWYGQPLQLRLPIDPAEATMTRPLGVNGAMVLRVSEREVKIVRVDWPTETDHERLTNRE